ncbi:MAG TPA: class I SAM-dependent methyltransferase [Candidatus Deferrimicrobium sp.]|nr:class I SAM-dependent methyltransferase [Candidatus Deferrimicrobium sp.]
MRTIFRRQNREKVILERINFILKTKDQGSGFILDNGTGSGKIAIGLQDEGFVVGIDHSSDFIKNRSKGIRVHFINAVGESLPFKSDNFQKVISQMVLEHVSNVKKYLREILRVLKQGGMLYLALPNRMFPIEPHTKIPLITYLPHKLFQKIINIKRGKTYPLNYLNYKLLNVLERIGYTKVWDITLFFLKRAPRFYPSVPQALYQFLIKTYRILRFFIPTWIWVLQKE